MNKKYYILCILLAGIPLIRTSAQEIDERKSSEHDSIYPGSGLSLSQEIAQWRGPERNGIYPGSGLSNEWPGDSLPLMWTNQDVGMGFSSAVVKDSIVYVTGRKDSIEYLSALDLSGKILWQIPYGLAPRQSFPDTRATPTIEGSMIYLISGRGQVVCVDADRKEVLWSIEAFEKYSGAFGRWEIVESPLIVDDKVIYTPAGHKTTMVAFNKHTGETVWESRSINDSTAYVSPIYFTRGGKKIIVHIIRNYLIGVDAANGDILWTYHYSKTGDPPWHPEAYHINCITPVYHDSKLFITSGYNHTSLMFNVSADGTEISLEWEQPVLDTHHGGVVLIDGYLYGSTWINNRTGNWACLDWETGEVKYEAEWKCKGSIIACDNKLILYEERTGYVGLVDPDPEEFRLISSFQHKEGTGPHWAHPAVYEGILYIRHGKTLTAYRIGD